MKRFLKSVWFLLHLHPCVQEQEGDLGVVPHAFSSLVCRGAHYWPEALISSNHKSNHLQIKDRQHIRIHVVELIHLDICNERVKFTQIAINVNK